MTASTPKQTRLADRILDAFPSGAYAMTGLLRLLDIVETQTVPTAAVQCVAQPRLLINPEFVRRHASTPEKLLMLVMHELHHVLLGHTTLFPRLTPAQNFVFDAVINGLVCRMFPAPAFTAFLTDYYRDHRFPECLLRPPPGWSPRQRTRDVSTAPGLEDLEPALRERAREVHAALYSAGGASYHEVFELLPQVLDACDAGRSPGLDVPLLGGHADNPQQPELEQISPLLFDLVRGIVEQWPQPPDPIRGRSLADVLKENTVSPRPPASRRTQLRSLIRKVAGHEGAGRLRHVAWSDAPAQTAVPRLSRRSAVLRAAGTPVLLYEAPTPWRRPRREGERVHVYLDVSGSMNSVLGALYGAALDCADLLWPQIHLFSTRVVDVSPAELRRGRCHTTGGTSIDVVASHIAAHHVRRALMITDGWVGKPEGQHRQTLERIQLAVAYLGDSINRNDLADVARYTATLNPGESS